MNLLRRLAALAAVTAAIGVVPVLASTAAHAAAPPWEPDPNALGTVKMYDAAGHQVTSGNNLSHLADWFAASTGKSSGSAIKATLYFAAPDHTQVPGNWFVKQESASTSFPNSSAPAPIKGPGFTNPVTKAGVGDADVTSFLSSAILDNTAGYANIVQIRLFDNTSDPQYWTADILVNTGAGTWQEVYPDTGGAASPSRYTAVSPCRLFDTRATQGTCTNAPVRTVGKLGAGATTSVKVTDAGGVPANATAVVLNLTAVNASAATFITAFPHGASRPSASNVNVSSAAAVPNLVIVKIGTGGAVDFFNASGTVNVIGDVAGYFAPATGAAEFSVAPCRAFDTRSGHGNCAGSPTVTPGKVGAGGELSAQVAGVGGVPANATAVIMNLTGVSATASTFVTAWASGGAKPGVSNLNVSSSAAVANLAVIPIGADGKIKLANLAGQINLIGDIAGYFSPNAGAAHTALTPCRALDTRVGSVGASGCSGAVALPKAKVGPGGKLAVQVRGVGGVPADATAVIVNVTAVGASTSTFITVWPGAVATQPVVSNINVSSAAAKPNLVVVPIGSDGRIQLANASGTVDLIGDIAGYFAPTA